MFLGFLFKNDVELKKKQQKFIDLLNNADITNNPKMNELLLIGNDLANELSSLMEEIHLLHATVSEKDSYIKQLESVIKNTDSPLVHKKTKMFNQQYYKECLSKNVNKNTSVLTIKINNMKYVQQEALICQTLVKVCTSNEVAIYWVPGVYKIFFMSAVTIEQLDERASTLKIISGLNFIISDVSNDLEINS
jgi:hypothetical protein